MPPSNAQTKGTFTHIFFQPKQGLLHIQPAAIAHQPPVGADDPVAGHSDQNGVPMVGHTHRPGRLGAPHSGSHLPIGTGLTVGNGTQRPPHPLLKFGAPEHVRKIKVPPPAIQIFRNLPKYQIGQRRPPLIPGRFIGPHKQRDRIVPIPNLELSKRKRINCITAHIPPSQSQIFASRGVLHPRDAAAF